jgi:hypothetical protein
MTYRKRRRTEGDNLGPIIDGDFLDAGGFMFMDHDPTDEFEKGAALARAAMVHDGRGNLAGHRPGFAFAGPPLVTDENLQEAATLAYEERKASLGRLLHGQEGTTGHGGKVPSSPAHPTHPKEAAELARAANEAYIARVERLRNAYKERPV